MRIVLAYIAAVVVGTLLVTLIGTQINLYGLTSVGAEVPLSARVDATLSDLAGFAPALAAIVALGYLIAFTVAGLIIRAVPNLRTFGYTTAGFVTVVLAMVLVSVVVGLSLDSNVTIVAPGRTPTGLAMLGMGGAMGGYLFAAMSRRA